MFPPPSPLWGEGRLRGRLLLFLTLLLIPSLAVAQGHVVTPAQLVWRPLIPGTEMAVVSGDPGKAGLYVLRIRTQAADARVPPHWHPTDEHITVLTGAFLVAHGEQYDASKLTELTAGAHAAMPARMPHFALQRAGSVIEIYGEGPFVVNWVNPEDDPSRAGKK